MRVQLKSETVNIEGFPLGGQVQVEIMWIYDWFPPRQGFCQSGLEGPWARK